MSLPLLAAAHRILPAREIRPSAPAAPRARIVSRATAATACAATRHAPERAKACTQAKKGGGSDGACAAVAAGSDPDGDCPDDGSVSCLRNGSCDGAGKCALYAAGSACSAGNSCNGNIASGMLCDGLGSCLASSGGVACDPFKCVAGACTTSCASSLDCAPAAYCQPSSGQCIEKGAVGSACTAAEDCISGLCIDGYCCNSACQGQCEACDVGGAEGKCVPVVGAPHGDRPPCGTGTSDDPCGAATCDGVERSLCASFVGTGVVCRSASCAAGTAVVEARCDGSGVCPALETKACAPFACGPTGCRQTCTSDSDCDARARCDTQSGICANAATCSGPEELTAANGELQSCTPYRCIEDRCATSCSSTADCARGAVCTSDQRCSAAPQSSGDGGSCAVRSASRAPAGQIVCWAVAAALALRRRRRRVFPPRAS